jgi:hypothetical protein
MRYSAGNIIIDGSIVCQFAKEEKGQCKRITCRENGFEMGETEEGIANDEGRMKGKKTGTSITRTVMTRHFNGREKCLGT